MTTTMQEGTITALTPNLVELSDGLRELADWIDANPEAANTFSFNKVTFLAPANDSKKLRMLGVALGVNTLDTETQWAQYVRSFGGVIDVQAYAKKENVCDYTVIGTKTEDVRAWTLKDES